MLQRLKIVFNADIFDVYNISQLFSYCRYVLLKRLNNVSWDRRVLILLQQINFQWYSGATNVLQDSCCTIWNEISTLEENKHPTLFC